MAIAYVRVSTDKQEVSNQLNAISVYCLANNLTIERTIEINGISSRRSSSERKIDEVLALPAGSLLIVSQLDRLGRSLTELVNIVESLKKHKIELHIIDRRMIIKPNNTDLTSTILTTTFALLSEIERSLISERTRSGLARVRLIKKLGRPLKHEFNPIAVADLIKNYGQRATARQLGCTLSSLQYFIKRTNI